MFIFMSLIVTKEFANDDESVTSQFCPLDFEQKYPNFNPWKLVKTHSLHLTWDKGLFLCRKVYVSSYLGLLQILKFPWKRNRSVPPCQKWQLSFSISMLLKGQYFSYVALKKFLGQFKRMLAEFCWVTYRRPAQLYKIGKMTWFWFTNSILCK